MKRFRYFHILDILNFWEKQTLPLDLFLKNYFYKNKSIGANDRRNICETIYRLIRWKSLFDHFCKSPITWEKRLDLYPTFNPDSHLNDPSIPLHIRVSFPKFYFDKLLSTYGEEKTKQICIDSNQIAPVMIRSNRLQIKRDDLFEKLQKNFKVKKSLLSEDGIEFEKKGNFFSLEEFKEGLFEIQDEASQLIANLVDAKPNQKVLDYCAGSGGKALSIAARMQQKGIVFLHDIRENALLQAKKRCKRARLHNVQFLFPDKWDRKKFRNKMDRLLLDVPCSGSGTLRRNPDLKWKWSNQMLDELLLLQRDIFKKAFEFVKIGGKIIYATCSIFSEENEKQIEFFLKNFQVSLATKSFFSSLPKKGKMDGFFGAVLQREA